ncbi:MAG: hypothetical protein HYU44_17910 [Betaproteobacteria bacterium]|nr:hypothetical protein [Betaproteobacteria bacterium]
MRERQRFLLQARSSERRSFGLALLERARFGDEAALGSSGGSTGSLRPDLASGKRDTLDLVEQLAQITPPSNGARQTRPPIPDSPHFQGIL